MQSLPATLNLKSTHSTTELLPRSVQHKFITITKLTFKISTPLVFRATAKITSLEFPPTLESSTISELDKEFSRVDWRSATRFAVRSSAVGEDSEELSAAGQNEARK